MSPLAAIVVVMSAQAPADPPPQTVWDHEEDEAKAAALGTLGVCDTLILPLSIVPVFGEYAGLTAEWLCIVPAALAAEHTALEHGTHAPHLWQMFIPLVAQKTWHTLIAIPFPIFVVAGGLAGLGLGTAGVITGLSPIVDVGLFLAPATAVFLLYGYLRDNGGNLIFSGLYELVDDSLEGQEHDEAARGFFLGPRQTGLVGLFALLATVNGAEATFYWPQLLPVVGPLVKASREAVLTKRRVRRMGVETLGEKKHDLTGMDSVVDLLAQTEGTLAATAQVGLIGSGALLVSSVVLWQRADTKRERTEADLVAAGGVMLAAFSALIVGVSKVPDAAKPCCVACAYESAPVVDIYGDPRDLPEVPPPQPKVAP